MKDSETHLRVSVLTDGFRVSSCVNVSRVRLGLALWVLQHLGNRRPDGGCIRKRLRWDNKNAHAFVARKQRCYNEGATKCFACESGTKTTNTTKLLKKGTNLFLGCSHFSSLITLYCTKWCSCTCEMKKTARAVDSESTFLKEKRSKNTQVHNSERNSIALNTQTWCIYLCFSSVCLKMQTELHFNNKAIIITILSPPTEQTVNAVLLLHCKANHLWSNCQLQTC